MGSLFNYLFGKGKINAQGTESNGKNGTSISEEVYCSATWGGEYIWSIEKTANPSTLELEDGESGNVNYLITVHNNPISGSEECVISGRVEVSNTGEEDTEGLKIIIELRHPPSKDILYQEELDLGSKSKIAAGETETYYFSFSPPSFTPGKSFKVTANTTITNHSGDNNHPLEGSCSDTYPESKEEINKVINVYDIKYPLSSTMEFTAIEGGGYQFFDYDITYYCIDRGEYTNTATIQETGAFSTAKTKVTCDNSKTTTISQEVDGVPNWKGEYLWDISKDVSKKHLDIFKGRSELVSYNITVTNSPIIGAETLLINGSVCITNTGTNNTKDLACNLKLILDSSGEIVDEIDLDLSSYPIIASGENHCFDFKFVLTEFTPGDTYKVVSTVSITNFDGFNGTPHEIESEYYVVLPAEPETKNEVIHVSDSYVKKTYEFTALNGGGINSLIYEASYNCSNEGDNTNVATILETGKSAQTTVTVTCYELEVSKTVVTSLTKKYTWSISKACIDPITKAELTTVTVSSLTYGKLYYVVSVNPVVTESDFLVSGEIKVTNPHPSQSIGVRVKDEITSGSDVYEATVEDNMTFIEPGETKTFNYYKGFESEITGINVATASYYDDLGFDVTASSTEVPVNFDNAEVLEIDPCVNVFDSYNGKLNSLPVCHSPASFEYTRIIGPYNACCDCGTEIENYAWYISHKTTGEVKNIVTICVL